MALRVKRQREEVADLSPEDGMLARFPIVMLSNESGAAAESFRALRTRLQSQHLQSGRRGLAVCTPSPEVGCSFVAANLAVAMSQIGIKTLLVDGDLRNPTVHRYFEPELSGPGLAGNLRSPDDPPADYVHENVLPNLDVMIAGTSEHNAYELLAGDGFPEVMNACLRDYDVTIVDTPPANSCADALRISTIIGYSLIVVRKNRSLVSDLKVLADQLKKERARVVGTVLNSY